MHEFVDYTALILLFHFFRQIFHNVKNKEQTKFDLLLQRLFICWFFPETVRLNIIMLMFYQIFSRHCSLLQNQIKNILSSPKFRQVIGTTHGF